MNIIGVIPARYQSSRLPGKPLADICGKPMIWWVYQQVKKVSRFDEVVVAIDDSRIREACGQYGLRYVMTKDNHPEHISRVHEVSENIKADLYVCVNGDEPLISPEVIEQALPQEGTPVLFSGAMRKLSDPAEALDPGNIKLAVNNDNECIYISRTLVPFPKGTLLFNYYKYVGIECFSKEALDYFVSTPQGRLEKIEDIDHLRFLENHKILNFTEVQSESISVDTAKDLEKVRKIISSKAQSYE